MKENIKLKEAIDNIFEEYNELNSYSVELSDQKGCYLDNADATGDIELANQMMQEEEWLKKLIYEAITAQISNDLTLYKSLEKEFVDYCDISKEVFLLNKYYSLLETFSME
jgi:hypothetical protein